MSRFFAIFALMVCFQCSTISAADTSGVLKVVACDLPGGRFSLDQIAADISSSNPDVVLLQGVRGWTMCDSLVTRIKSQKYTVVTCSSFLPGSSNAVKEVAILSRHPALQAWTQRIGTNVPTGGFAFAVLQVGQHRWGFFSVQLGRAQLSPGIKEAVASQVASARAWSANVPESFMLVTSRFPNETKPRIALEEALESAGFAGLQDAELDRFAGAFAAKEKRFASASVAGTNGALVLIDVKYGARDSEPSLRSVAEIKTQSQVPRVAHAMPRLTGSAPISESATNAPAKTPTPMVRPLVGPEKQPPDKSLPARITSSAYFLPGTICAGLLVVSGIFYLRKRATRAQKRAISSPEVGPNAAYIVVSPSSSTASGDNVNASAIHSSQQHRTRTDSARPQQGVVRMPSAVSGSPVKHGLVEWLKAEFVRRLVRDRGVLLRTQVEAARAAAAAGERLERLEARIQQQNELYNNRMELLARELAATREENKALIRMRIAQLKSDMEEERAKIIREG